MITDTPDQSFRRVAPAIKPMTAFTLPEVRRRMLPSGIELLIYDRCDVPCNSLTFVMPGGSCEMGPLAYSSLISVMRNEGTRTFSGDEINSRLDFNGSWLKCTTSAHHTSIEMRSLNKRLADTLPVFRSVILEPTMPDGILAVRREALASRLEVAMSDVDFLASCKFSELAAGKNHPEALVDNPDDVRAVSSDTLLGLIERCETPSRGKLFLCGMITPDIEELVAATFSDIPQGDDHGIKIIPYTPAPAGTVEKVVRPEASQSAVMMMLPGVKRAHPDHIPLHITVSALGGYFGSRLMLNIRERLGLTYGISASLNSSANGSYIQIMADTACDSVDRLRAEVARELERMSVDPPRGEELSRLRQTLLSQQAAIVDNPFSIMAYYAGSVTADIPNGYFDAKLRAIEALTPGTLAETAARYLRPEFLRTAIAGA